MPPSLDAEKVRKLGALAGAIDGASLSSSSDLVAEFNQCAGTTLTHAEFQGIYGAEEHVDWVRRLLWEQQIRPAANVSRDEIVELVRRCTPVAEWSPDLEAYAMILDANLGFQASSLLFDSVPVPASQEASAGPTSLEEVADWLLSRAPRRFLVAPNGDVEVVGDQS